MEIRIWDVDTVENADPEWPNRPREERHAMLQDPSTYPAAPIHEGETTNLAVDGYFEALAAGDNPQPTHLAIGDDDTPAEATNTSLNNEVYRTVVGDDEPDGRDRVTSTFISQNEANGYTLREIGFVTGAVDDNWQLLTHVALDSTDHIDKTSNNMIVYNYTLEWRRVS
ncbi:hypothetical protein C484_10646 [Natrialba taiwanensis DSM 12281]|uniref:Uncharacterized protein n=1 Tax=Natrialba taiwanensis DSM 12281 TaxID=1230458 RepID=L9ZY97_9EURY|nr:hypothetical protein C484_10646 [Natrialba taiwanensis DSM 12281]